METQRTLANDQLIRPAQWSERKGTEASGTIMSGLDGKQMFSAHLFSVCALGKKRLNRSIIKTRECGIWKSPLPLVD